MTEQLRYIFIPIVSHKDSFCHRGESKLKIRLFIHERLREPLINLWYLRLARVQSTNFHLQQYNLSIRPLFRKKTWRVLYVPVKSKLEHPLPRAFNFWKIFVQILASLGWKGSCSNAPPPGKFWDYYCFNFFSSFLWNLLNNPRLSTNPNQNCTTLIDRSINQSTNFMKE